MIYRLYEEIFWLGLLFTKRSVAVPTSQANNIGIEWDRRVHSHMIIAIATRFRSRAQKVHFQFSK